MSKELFLKRLVDCRIKSNLSQAQFAKIMNVSQATIARQETGVSNPSIDMLEKYADFFNCSTDYLLGRTDQPGAYFLKKEIPSAEPADSSIQSETPDPSKLSAKEVQAIRRFLAERPDLK